MKRAAAVACAALLAAAARDARASAFDLAGFGPAGVAEVGARAARASDGTATFYSPGGLALGSGVSVEIAPTLAISALSAQGALHPIDDPFGVALAFAATVPLGEPLKDRLRFGLGAYLLAPHLARVVVPEQSEPVFPYFENRTQRLVVLPALALKITRALGIGGGVDVLGGVSGAASVTQGESGAPEPRVDLAATTRIAAVAGARFDPSPEVHLAFTYRGHFFVPSNIQTSTSVGGLPLAVTVDVGQSLFDPDAFVLGASYGAGHVEAEIDATYSAWSMYHAPFVDVHATLPAVDVSSVTPPDIAHDVVSVRGAASYRFDVRDHRLFLRGGLGFEPTMLRSFQQGETNLVDGDKIFVGVGASLELAHVVGHALRFGLGVNTTIVTTMTQDKRACVAAPCPADSVAGPDAAHPGVGVTNPGFPTLHGGGAFVTSSASVGVDL